MGHRTEFGSALRARVQNLAKVHNHMQTSFGSLLRHLKEDGGNLTMFKTAPSREKRLIVM
jgi:hypothetical protein